MVLDNVNYYGFREIVHTMRTVPRTQARLTQFVMH